MSARPPKPTDPRVTVYRDGQEWEMVIGYTGRYHAATRLDPEEFPDPYIAFAWLDGACLADPMEVPEDVALEAIAIDAEREVDESEPDEYDDEGSAPFFDRRASL